MKIIKSAFITVLSVTVWMQIAAAQNLPAKQKDGLRAPDNTKIDGKPNEWGNGLQAYNNATEVYYTIANDNDNLYLAIQAKYQDIIDKIIRGGITITLNHSKSKRDKDTVSLTYPVMRNGASNDVTGLLSRKFIQAHDNDSTFALTDLNALYQSRSKVINLAGISQIADSEISVYNDLGIKAAAGFDGKIVFTCELSLPLKYLKLTTGQPFAYHVKINAPAELPIPKPAAGAGLAPPPPPTPARNVFATDFWGEYQLVDK